MTHENWLGFREGIWQDEINVRDFYLGRIDRCSLLVDVRSGADPSDQADLRALLEVLRDHLAALAEAAAGDEVRLACPVCLRHTVDRHCEPCDRLLSLSSLEISELYILCKSSDKLYVVHIEPP